MKTTILALLSSFFLAAPLPSCAVRSVHGEVATVGVSVEARPRCHPSRYWNGDRCVKRHRHRHYRHYHYYHYGHH